MKFLVLMFALLLPVIGFAAWEPEYHANFITITFLDEIVLSVVFFVVNVFSSIFYDVLGPLTTYLLIYFGVFIYYIYKNTLTARIGDIYKTLYVSPMNNFLTKTIFFYVLLYTLLIPVEINMYKLGGDKNDGLSHKITLVESPNNRIKDETKPDVNEKYHNGYIETLSNTNIKNEIASSSANISEEYMSNKAPLVLAAPINFIQRVIYGVPFLTDDKINANNAIIENNYSLMNIVDNIFPKMGLVYHATVQEPSTLINVYVNYFSKVTEISSVKNEFLDIYTKYIMNTAKAFSVNHVWDNENLITYALPPLKINNTQSGQIISNNSYGQEDNEYRKEIVGKIVKRYNEYIYGINTQLTKTTVSTDVIKKLAILEFMSFFGFEDELTQNNGSFYTQLNNIIKKDAQPYVGTASFPVEKTSYTEHDYKELVLKIESMLFEEDLDVVKKLEITSDTDIDYLYKKLYKYYEKNIYSKYEAQSQIVLPEFKLPKIEHPLATVINKIKLSSHQKDLYRALKESFHDYNKKLGEWLDASIDEQTIKKPIVDAFKDFVKVFFKGHYYFLDQKSAVATINEQIDINALIEKQRIFFEKLQKYNEKRRMQFVDSMIKKKMFDKYVNYDIYTGTLKSFINNYMVAGSKMNKTTPVSSLSISEYETEPHRKIRTQDYDEESKRYDDYDKSVEEVLNYNAGGSVATGFYFVNRRTLPITLNYSSGGVWLVDAQKDDKYHEYIYFNVFNTVLMELYNKNDNMLKTKYGLDLLLKTGQLNINGANTTIDPREKMINLISEVTSRNLTEASGNQTKYIDYDQSNIPGTDKMFLVYKFQESMTSSVTKKSDKGGDIYKSAIFNIDKNQPTLEKILRDYNREVNRVKQEQQTKYESIVVNPDIYKSTNAFKYKMYNNQNIKLMMDNGYQSNVFNMVYDDVKRVMFMYKMFLNTYIEDPAMVSQTLGISKMLQKTPMDVVSEFLSKYKPMKENTNVSLDEGTGYVLTDITLRILRKLYVPLVDGLYASENAALDIKLEEFGKVGLILAAWGTAETIESVGGFFGKTIGAIIKGSGTLLKATIFIFLINSILLSIMVIFIAIMLILFFKEYIVSFTKSLYEMGNSLLQALISLSKGDGIPESLDKVFYASIKIMMAQLPLVVLMLGSIVFDGIIKYIMSKYYIKEIFFNDFDAIDNLTLIVMFGVFTLIYLKMIMGLIKKITKHEGFGKIAMANGVVASKVKEVGGKATHSVYDSAKSTASKAEELAKEKVKSTESYKSAEKYVSEKAENVKRGYRDFKSKLGGGFDK